MSVAHFYDWLARFQDWARSVGHDTGRSDLTVHRRLRGEAGEPSGTTLHTRLLEALQAYGGVSREPRLLDAGCGLGGTTFFLQHAFGGRAVGITLSEGQRRRASDEAARRGLGDACRFVVRSYDADLTDLCPDGLDLVVAIESLAHSPDPAATLGRLAARLRPDGVVAIVDDMPASGLAWDDADFAGFRDGWMVPALATADAIEAALRSAGLDILGCTDLTYAVPHRAPGTLERLIRVNRAVQMLSRHTPARTLVESLHGGLMLERLYRRGAMRYLLVVARRPAA